MRSVVVFSVLALTSINWCSGHIYQLRGLDIDRDSITLSGFSSGGNFAQQLFVSYSSMFQGVAVFSHTYYRCGGRTSYGDPVAFDLACTILKNLTLDKIYDPNLAVEDIKKYSAANLIDDSGNLKNKRLYVYAGTKSTVFTTDMTLRILNVFQDFIDCPHCIKTRVQYADIILPTDSFGERCPKASKDSFFIGNCGINGPKEAISFLTQRSLRSINKNDRNGMLKLFDQSEFLDGDEYSGFDKQGYIYIPPRCEDGSKKCALHFYFHGCWSGREFVGTNHVENSGYLELADSNDMVIVFPQTKSGENGLNKIGCWDTYGFTGSLHATKLGKQVSIVKMMLDKILSRTTVPTQAKDTRRHRNKRPKNKFYKSRFKNRSRVRFGQFSNSFSRRKG